MPRQVLIIPDKFKGTLTAPAAARAIARGWRKAHPTDHLQLLPMSDGGDGFGPILGTALGALGRTAQSVDASGRPCRVRWWWQERKRVAVVESARVIGLAMLPPARFHPFELDTTGLGRLLKTVVKHQCTTCLIGIGGSATNDGGFGMARALGWRFVDRQDRALDQWVKLTQLHRLVPPQSPYRMEVIVASDVRNPLLGPSGASRVYGPQKGLRPQDQRLAEAALRRLAAVSREFFQKDFGARPGAGAAGGLGFALMAFLGARIEPGSTLFGRYARLDDFLGRADLVVTAEGAIDRSSLMGKGVGEIATLCRAHGIPCVGLGGIVSDQARLRRTFARVAALAPDLTTREQAMAQPAHWLARLAEQVAAAI